MVELVWDGKYDKDGKRVAPLRVSLPFQTVETVNESAQQRQRTLDLFAAGRDPEWRNRLIWGDKKYVLPSLLPEFAGKVDLIYIDPPFATGQDFSFQAQVGDDKFDKQASIIEQKAYRDTWGKGLDGYLQWFFEAAIILYELLSETGSLYVHLDETVSHYVKTILDSVFGLENFRNEVIWCYRTGGAPKTSFARKHDVILFYTINEKNTFTPQKERSYLTGQMRHSANKSIHVDEHGEYQNIIFSKTEIKLYRDKQGYYTMVNCRDYWNIDAVGRTSKDRVNYPTQKPEALLERIIRASSNEGDLVLDCFCGSGTAPAVAEKLKRRWIACDLGRFAMHTTRKRLLGIDNVRPFVVQNLGKYERQRWQKAEFGAEAAYKTRRYRRFILDLYHAELVEGYTWLHGRKGRRMVHVGSVDSPVAAGDVRQTAIEFRRAIGAGANGPRAAGVDVLGWDFALDMNETAQQTAREAGVKLRFLRIPREVLEKKAVDQGDIHFFELAALSVSHQCARRELSIELTDFMIPPDDVPDDVMKAVRHWSDWIDYWAVDFDYRDDTFHNQWQTYRTRKDRTLLLRANHRYSEPGDYVVLVKAIDILGNDTTKTLSVKVV
ncbi:MAG: DNA methyltransferase [Chloroflexi bacterium]|nr:DNA methyltransferase [Chloroflexota bacterium]MCY4247040.1 DNA methyltransferase [Chloroflexota bacterium]